MSIDVPKKSERGRPPVDSEAVRARIHRPVLTALDAYIVSQPDSPGRPEAIRRILVEWLREKGYLPKG